MSSVRGSFQAVMEGSGSYNRHAQLPADGAALALPILNKAIRDVDLSGEGPIVIADYGSSQGKNSLVPMKSVITGLRKRAGAKRAISVFHVDQPSNDFNSLFEVLDADPGRYVADDPNVYPAAIGRSFYQSVLPPGSVHVGWSSYAAVWLSRVPQPISDHFIAIRSKGARAAFDRQAAEDWVNFLALRSRELRPGGRIVVVLPGVTDDGAVGIEPIFDNANAVLDEMVSDGAITSEQRSRMALTAHPRRKQDILAPFVGNGQFENMTVEDFAMSEVYDGAWEQYSVDNDKDALAAKRALFFRSVFVPSLAGALSAARGTNGNAVASFANQIQQRLQLRLANHLSAIRSLVQVLMLARQHPAKE